MSQKLYVVEIGMMDWDSSNLASDDGSSDKQLCKVGEVPSSLQILFSQPFTTYWNYYLTEKKVQGHQKNLLGLTTDTLKQMGGQNMQNMYCRYE